MPTVGCEVLMTPSMLAVPWVVNEIVPVGAGPESSPPPPEKVDFRLIASFPNAIPLLIPPLTSPLLKLVMVLARPVPTLITSFILPNKPFDFLAETFVKSINTTCSMQGGTSFRKMYSANALGTTAMEDSSTPIESGKLILNASVDVSYFLK